MTPERIEEVRQAHEVAGLRYEPIVEDKPPTLRELLEKYQVRAMEAQEPVDAPFFGEKAVIHPGGGKIAKKYCRFKVELPAAVILIADQSKPNGDWPNVKIEISGERCLTYPGGGRQAYIHAFNLIRDLGGRLLKESVSRVDIAADFPGMGIGEFYRKAQRKHWTCRSRLYHPYVGQDGISLYWGSGDIVLRVYDKLKEMRMSALRGQPAKYQHMIEKRWGRVEPEHAIRVEYQCRREWLKKYGVSDFDSLQEKLGDLIAYLVGTDEPRWFRFLTARPDPKHPENNVVLPRWKFVQDVFLKEFSLIEPVLQVDPDEADVETLIAQAVGVLLTAAENKGFLIPDRRRRTCAPEKYHFRSREHFLQWAGMMIRARLAEESIFKPEQSLRKEREPDLDEAHERFMRGYMEAMERSEAS